MLFQPFKDQHEPESYIKIRFGPRSKHSQSRLQKTVWQKEIIAILFDIDPYITRKRSLLAERGLLGAFAKVRKATVSFVTSVCPSLQMEQLSSHWTDIHEISYISVFRKSVEKTKCLLTSENSNKCIPLCGSQNEGSVRQEPQRKSNHILCSMNLYFPKIVLFV